MYMEFKEEIISESCKCSFSTKILNISITNNGYLIHFHTTQFIYIYLNYMLKYP